MAQIVRYPDSPFILHQPFPPAGDQPSAIEALSEGLEDGVMFQTLLGVTGSGKTYTMANVIARLGVPALIMAPNKTLAAQTYAEMRDFFPENAVEYFVSYYDFYQPEAYVPARDLFIEKDAAVNEHIEQMRLAATKSILERRDTIIVATVSAIYGIGKPESSTVRLTIDDVMDTAGLPLLGIVLEDCHVTLAAAFGLPLLKYASRCEATRDFRRIAARLQGYHKPIPWR